MQPCPEEKSSNRSVNNGRDVDKLKPEDIVDALNNLDHETLSHKMFLGCFGQAVKSGQIRGLKKTSLFRSTLAYFLLASNARENFLKELAHRQK